MFLQLQMLMISLPVGRNLWLCFFLTSFLEPLLTRPGSLCGVNKENFKGNRYMVPVLCLSIQ